MQVTALFGMRSLKRAASFASVAMEPNLPLVAHITLRMIR